jgi:hypothetical protein
VTLAAALALRAADIETDLYASASQTTRSDALEKYLKLTIQRSRPGALPYNEAVRHLVREWLDRKQIAEMLAWLDDTPAAVDALGDLESEVAHQAVAQSLE